MQRPPQLSDEQSRQTELDAYAILDSISEAEFDNITSLAALVCDTPISLISLVDKDRQWFKSNLGLPPKVQETHRDFSFCAHAIHSPTELFEVRDATSDERFADNPLVTDEPRVIFYAGIPLLSSAGHPLGTICVIDHEPKELTDRQRAFLKGLGEQVSQLLENRRHRLQLERKVMELQVRNENLDRFASTAAHDLKMPLRQIASVADLLVSDFGTQLAPDEKQLLQQIHDSTRKLHELIEDILSYSRSKNYGEVRREWVDLDELISSIVQLFSSIAGCKISTPTNLKLVYLDKSSFQQVLINLLSNAVKYCDKTDIRIGIDFWETPEQYQFSVTDNGPGISLSIRDSIFELYMKSATKDRNGEYGYGIGLATVKNLVQAQGGTIDFVTEAGQGTTFNFAIPKVDSGDGFDTHDD